MKEGEKKMNELRLTKTGRKELRLLIFELAAELNSIANELVQKALSAERDSELYETLFTMIDTYLPGMTHSYSKDFDSIDDEHVHFEHAS